MYAAATPRRCRFALLGMVVLLIVVAYFPFAWDPPRIVHNEVTRSANGSLQFGEMNNARTPGTPAWLQDACASGRIQIQLQADPQSLGQNASIFMLASDFWHTDFAIGQDGSDLDVWLRRAGSDVNGDPPFVVGRVIRPGQWISVNLTVQDSDLRIVIDGRTRLVAHISADSLRLWSPGLIALGDEVQGGGPWTGQIRLAEVRTPGHAVDYVRPGALSIPQTYLYLPDHFDLFPPAGTERWVALVLDILSFVPVGFLIVLARRPPVPPIPASLLGALIVVTLAAGKFLFHDRHTSPPKVALEAAGMLLGTLLAWRWHRATWRLLPSGQLGSLRSRVVPRTGTKGRPEVSRPTSATSSSRDSRRSMPPG